METQIVTFASDSLEARENLTLLGEELAMELGKPVKFYNPHGKLPGSMYTTAVTEVDFLHIFFWTVPPLSLFNAHLLLSICPCSCIDRSVVNGVHLVSGQRDHFHLYEKEVDAFTGRGSVLFCSEGYPIGYLEDHLLIYFYDFPHTSIDPEHFRQALMIDHVIDLLKKDGQGATEIDVITRKAASIISTTAVEASRLIDVKLKEYENALVEINYLSQFMDTAKRKSNLEKQIQMISKHVHVKGLSVESGFFIVSLDGIVTTIKGTKIRKVLPPIDLGFPLTVNHKFQPAVRAVNLEVFPFYFYQQRIQNTEGLYYATRACLGASVKKVITQIVKNFLLCEFYGYLDTFIELLHNTENDQQYVSRVESLPGTTEECPCRKNQKGEEE